MVTWSIREWAQMDQMTKWTKYLVNFDILIHVRIDVVLEINLGFWYQKKNPKNLLFQGLMWQLWSFELQTSKIFFTYFFYFCCLCVNEEYL
jgi:hypothetical protein